MGIQRGDSRGQFKSWFRFAGSVPDADKDWNANKKYMSLLNIRRQNEVAVRINIVFKIFDEVKILLSLPDWSWFMSRG